MSDTEVYRPQPGDRFGHAVPIAKALGANERVIFGVAPGVREVGLGKQTKLVKVGVCQFCEAPHAVSKTAEGAEFYRPRRDCCLQQAEDYYKHVRDIVARTRESIDLHRRNWKGQDYIPPTALLDQLDDDQAALDEAARNYRAVKRRGER